jgi:hypothetical protein
MPKTNEKLVLNKPNHESIGQDMCDLAAICTKWDGKYLLKKERVCVSNKTRYY